MRKPASSSTVFSFGSPIRPIGRVGEKATPVARPTLPSSNRRCRFPASGSPESSCLRHAQCPIDGSAPIAPNAEASVLLADDGMASGYAVANAGSDGPERSVRSHSRYSSDTQRKSSSSILSGADSALQSRPGWAYGSDDDSSSHAASPVPAGLPFSTGTRSSIFDRVLSDHGRTGTYNPES